MQDGVKAEIGEDGAIWLDASLRYRELCKLVPGCTFTKKNQAWTVPLSWAACKSLRGVFGDDLHPGPALWAWASDYLDNWWTPMMYWRAALTIDGSDSAEAEVIRSWRGDGEFDLYGFQEAGATFMKYGERVLLADDMGSGKGGTTASTVRLIRELGDAALPMLVICPNGIKMTWKREVDRWAGLTVAVADGGAKARRDAIFSGADVVVINYEAAWRMSRLAPYGSVALTDKERKPQELNEVEWRTVVIDEAHKIKGPLNKSTRGVWFLGHMPSVRYRYALTGTPIANAPDDLWSILHFLDPVQFPSRQAFVDRYCLQAYSPYGGLVVVGIRPEMRAEFYSVLDPMMRRMPKALVLPFLPPKVRERYDAEMTPKQRRAYKQMETEMIAQLGPVEGEDPDFEDQLVAATKPIVKQTRLMQFASSYAELDELNHVKLSLPSNKVDALLEIADDLGDEPFVVFAQSRQLIVLAGEALAKQKPPVSCAYIVGGMTADQRYASEMAFQDGHVRAVLCTIGAGAEGITLTRAKHLVFMQRAWSMLGNKQAEDRVHRIGSEVHDSITIIDLVAPGTKEEGQLRTLYVKMERLEEIVRDRATLLAAGQVAAAAQLELEEQRLLEESLEGSAA